MQPMQTIPSRVCVSLVGEQSRQGDKYKGNERGANKRVSHHPTNTPRFPGGGSKWRGAILVKLRPIIFYQAQTGNIRVELGVGEGKGVELPALAVSGWCLGTRRVLLCWCWKHVGICKAHWCYKAATPATPLPLHHSLTHNIPHNVV